MSKQYAMNNGILYEDGMPVIALGQSYYPSYHVQKVPVPVEGDRVAEMALDLKAMREAGFNMCRIAALGDIAYDEGQVSVSFPLPDAFCGLCAENDIAAMVRLQGYSMNLRGFEDATMLDAQGRKMPFHWSWFVRNSLCHPGIQEDNILGTKASAAHFAQQPGVVSFQIYNEPAYPSKGLYDYHPYAIAAFRAWLAEKDILPAAEAAQVEIPRQRPGAEGDTALWAHWRAFHMERLNGYLVQMGETAKEGHPAAETLTCHLGTPFNPGNAIRGTDYYQTADGMDVLGITHYIPCRGPIYHWACLTLDGAESAAACFGKHAWLIEYNARTNMPPIEWERETYAALGRGFKGILYYQWRADYPYPDSPEPEGFGLLYNDRRKTPVYDTAIAMNGLVNRLSTPLAQAEKVRSGVCLLYSNHASAYYDAIDNVACDGVEGAHDRYTLAMRAAYRQLNATGCVVDVLRAEDLAENKLGIRTLILPMIEGLSTQELAQIEAFQAASGQVYAYEAAYGCFAAYRKDAPPRLHGIVYDEYDGQTLVEVCGARIPARVTGAAYCDARLLSGPAHDIVCLVNYDPLERPVEGATLHLAGGTYREAMYFDLDHPQGLPVPVDGHTISLPRVRAGAMILLTA